MTKTLVVALLILAVLVVAGCGSSAPRHQGFDKRGLALQQQQPARPATR